MPKNGVIIYDGPSEIDGAPIVALANPDFASQNPKTGRTVQTYILRRDVSPITAVNTGEDKSVCGDCIFRKTNAGGCYVNIGFSVNNVFRAFLQGGYASVRYSCLWTAGRALKGRVVRLGSYGDPAAVPFDHWQLYLEQAGTVIGYTHQWRDCDQRHRRFCMASCDTALDAIEAQAKGWRTFRVRLPDESLMPGEIVCPGSAEAGHRTSCERCRFCGGTDLKAAHIAIEAHGKHAGKYHRWRTTP